MSSIDEDLQILDAKLNQLKLGYDQYFLGSRPREPALLHREVSKQVLIYSNTPIQNTAMRFKFNSICSRFHAFKRQWDEILRKIEQGTYERHRFKAKIHEQAAQSPPPAAGKKKAEKAKPGDIFDDYLAARRSCGQEVKHLTPEKLQNVIRRQEKALREKHGDARFRFRVVVEDGKAKLKASRVKKTG
jgi:hypothetical protein